MIVQEVDKSRLGTALNFMAGDVCLALALRRVENR